MKNIKYKNNIFPIIIRKEKDGYTVTNPTFEGCYSQGDTVEEALINIKEATGLCIEETVKPHEKL